MLGKWLNSLFALVLTISIASCASVIVKPVKNDDTTTKGVRYYESEPYLLVTKEVPKATTPPGSSPVSNAPSGDKPSHALATPSEPSPAPAASAPSYNITIVWLPNYNKGYAVKVKSGLGTANGSLKLANGWQLTEFGGIVDTKIPETITATTGLVKAIGALTLKLEQNQNAFLPGLYRLQFDTTKGYCVGWEAVVLFHEESK
jgi:hypothetical protein